MRRRDALRRTVGAVGGLTTTMLAGCLNDGDGGASGTRSTDCLDRTDVDLTVNPWRNETGGRIESVSNGQVLGVESSRDGDGSVFALDAETGTHQWSAGWSGGYLPYLPFTVVDAIYVGRVTDTGGGEDSHLAAYEFDGTERWNVNHGNSTHRPRVVGDRVYVGSDDGVVRSIRTADGESEWETDVTTFDGVGGFPIVTTVGRFVYVVAGPVLALDRLTGTLRWRYGTADSRFVNAPAADGVAFVDASDGVVAVSSAGKRWRTDFEDGLIIRSVSNDRVVVESDGDLYGLDAATGERKWVVEFGVDRDATRCGETMYARASAGGEEDEGTWTMDEDGTWTKNTDTPDERGTETIAAIDLVDGTERWRNRLDGGPVESIQTERRADGETVFVETASQLYALNDDGRVTRSVGLTSAQSRTIRPLDGEHAVVGTDDAVYAVHLD